MSYKFRQARNYEVNIFYSIIVDRVKWMKENNIKQWNEEYLDIYPLKYYEENIDKLYVLIDNDDILCGAIILKEDSRWKDNEDSAYYIHNFASSINNKGSGILFIKELENLAIINKIKYLRLDSIFGSNKLEEYYSNLGFKECGECFEGNYHGILREKKVG